MQLYINTTIKDKIIIGLKEGNDFIIRKEIESVYRHSETLLPEIEKMLIEQGLELKQLEDIEVEKSGGSFSSLRIGILTANSLAYSLGITVNHLDPKSGEYVSPEYNGLPNISKKSS